MPHNDLISELSEHLCDAVISFLKYCVITEDVYDDL